MFRLVYRRNTYIIGEICFVKKHPFSPQRQPESEIRQIAR